MSSDLNKFIAECRERLDANEKYVKDIKYAVHDKIELIAQTAAMHMSLKDRLSEQKLLLQMVELQSVALEACFNESHSGGLRIYLNEVTADIDALIKKTPCGVQ